MCIRGRSFPAILAMVTLIAFPVQPVNAGDYHTGSTLDCSDCHVSHASISHGNAGQPSSYSAQPSAHLLKAATVVELCLQCHDNQPGIPDVKGADANSPSEQYDGTERAGGQFPDDSSDSWKGHNLPGQGNGSLGDCTNCHDQHGNANYRNLRALDGSEEGPVAYVNPTATGLDRYRGSNIGYVKNIGDKLCVPCHDFGTTRNTSRTGGGGQYHRHPSSDASQIVTIGSAGGSTDAQHWTAGSGCGFDVSGQPVRRVPFAMSTASTFEAASTVSADNEVFCLSCHKAHGSVHAFGMRWPYGGGGLLSSSGCNQCHNTSGE